MARVLVASQPWGLLWQKDGNRNVKIPAAGQAASINTTVYAAATGAGTVAFVTNDDGELPGYVEPGSWTLTVGAETFPAEAVSGASVLALEGGRVRNALAADPLNTVAILQGTNYNVITDGIPNVAAAGNLDYAISTGVVVSDDTSSKNRFQVASYVYNDLNQPTVALFGMGKGKHVFGANIVGYTDGADHTAIGVELDYGNVRNTASTVSGDHVLPITTLNVASTVGASSTGIVASGDRFWRYTGITATSFTGLTFESGTNSGTLAGGTATFASVGGTATGLLIVAIGGNVGGSPAGPYIQLHSQTASQATTGIKIHNSGQPAVMKTGNLIQATGEHCSIGVAFSQSKFTTGAAFFPVNSGATTASHGILIQAQGGLANQGSGIQINADGSGATVKYGIRVLSGIESSGVVLQAPVTAAVGVDFLGSSFSVGAIRFADGNNIALGTGAGTKIGTATTQKLGFFNATPVAKPTGVAVDAASIHAALISLGLIAA